MGETSARHRLPWAFSTIRLGHRVSTTKHRFVVPCIAAAALVALAQAPVNSQTWTPEGPAGATNGQVEGITDKPVTGAIEAVVAHPSNASIIWIGAVNGGIFRTNNATATSPTWTPQTDAHASLSIASLELDPTDATNNTLVAGLGRTSSFGGRGGIHNGILRTTNGGSTWTALSSGITGLEISGVAPRGSTIVVAAEDADAGFLSTGVYRSTNSGASFSQVSGASGTGLPIGRAFDMASDPTDNTRLFVIIRDTGTVGSSGIYRSDDTGATWVKVSNATQETLLNAPANDANLAVGEAGPTTPNVYSAICTSGQLAGLHRTGNGSVATPTWTALDLPSGTIHPGGQCSIHLSLVADPGNANVVYVGGDRQPSGFPTDVGAFNFSGRLFRVDAAQAGGSQATPITHCGSSSPSSCAGSQRTASNSSPHADSREMVFDANGDIIEVDDGGIYRHTDPSGTTGDWVSVIGNLAVTEHHDGILDGVSGILMGGNQDTGTMEQMSVGDTWFSVSTADGGDVAVGEDDPISGQSTRYSSFQNLGSFRRRVYNSSNVLQSQQFPSLTPLGGSPSVSGQFVTPVVVNSVTPTRLLIGASNGVYESLDRASSVTRISTAVVNGSGRGPMAYGVASNTDVIYFGSGDDIYVRTGGPGSLISSNDPDGASSDFIVGIVIDPDDANTAFAVDSDQVFRTINAGSSWTDITGDLQTLTPSTLRALEYISSGGDRLVVGANTKVYVATETGGFSSWSVLGTGLPNVPVFELDYDVSANLLAAATLGRGSWTLTPTTGSCPTDLVFASQTLSGSQTHDATASITLGPSLTINGTSITMRAPLISFLNGTDVSGTFAASNTPACP